MALWGRFMKRPYNYHHKWIEKSPALQAPPKEGNFPILRGSKGDLFSIFFFDFSLMRKDGICKRNSFRMVSLSTIPFLNICVMNNALIFCYFCIMTKVNKKVQDNFRNKDIV